MGRKTPKKNAVAITVLSANKASWEDLQAIFGSHGYTQSCQCQHFKIRDKEWKCILIHNAPSACVIRHSAISLKPASRADLSRIWTENLLDGAQWNRVRPIFVCPIPVLFGQGGMKTKTDTSVWAVTCFLTRKGFRHRGVSRALASAAVNFARERGAPALKGYPMVLKPGQEITWDEIRVGSRNIFAEAGFREVSKPSKRRVVMRIDF